MPGIRIQLDMVAARVKDLDDLQAKTGLATRKDVLEGALTLMEWCVKQATEGRKIVALTEHDNGTDYIELDCPMLNNVRPDGLTKQALSELSVQDTQLLKQALNTLRRSRNIGQLNTQRHSDIERLEKLLKV